LEKEVGITRPPLTKALKRFVEWGLVKTRYEKKTYYSINRESPIVETILQLDNLLIEKLLGEETLYEIHDYLQSKKPLVETTSATVSMERKSKPSDCVETDLSKIPKPRIWWQEPAPFNNQEFPLVNEPASIYLSGATT
jgi:hypothetical protein